VLASAIAKLGARLLGLNWRLTPDEVRHVLADSAAGVLVCDDPAPAALLPALDGLPIRLRVSIDASASGFVDYAALLREPAEQRFSAGDPPLVIYTSGTTGLPKGAVTGQRSAFFTPEEFAEYRADIAESRRSQNANAVTLVTMPMHHAAGPNQVWRSLRMGRPMILMRRFEPEAALALVERHRVTDWATVPTMLKRLAALPPERLARYDVSSIEYLSVGAAPVPWSVKDWALGHFGEHCLYEGYGTTETSMVTRLTPDQQRARRGASGFPYRHVTIEIRDPRGNRLPAGRTGEIWIRTPNTIGAYLDGKPLDTDTLDADGFFRPGDVGHLDADGCLYITDRAKDMIIAGGVNLYPAEIEAALIRHPAIQDVAVIGIPDDEFGERVAAFCELKPGGTLPDGELERFAAESLASYKCPRLVRVVDELPRNTMGKVLKRELRQPFWQGRERAV
jgi:long-chain acyl-CoA synthetase